MSDQKENIPSIKPAQDEVGLAGITAAIAVGVGAHQKVIAAIAIHVAGARDGPARGVSG